MSKEAIKTLIIMVTAVLTSTATAFAGAEVTSELELEVQPAVSIIREYTNDEGSISVLDGTQSGLSSAFLIETNSRGADFDFVLTSTIMTKDGEVSAFGEDGKVLLFAHETNYPDSTAVVNAKKGEGASPNVVAYRIETSVTQPMKLEWAANHEKYGPCWLILPNAANEGELTQTVSSPYKNTYEKGTDMSGWYKAVVTLSIQSP